MEQMEGIRDQQESLAKLHFDLGGKQDPFAPLSEEGNLICTCGAHITQWYRIGISIRTCGKSLKGQLSKSYTV